MRKTILALGLAAVLAAVASAQQSNSVPTNNVPFITATMITNVVTQVQPLVLTPAQMGLVISNLQSIGIGGNVPITAAILQRVMVVRRTDGSFLVTMQLH